MPNARCDACEQYLNTSAKTKQIIERAQKRFGIIYNVTPGVKHREVDPDNTAGPNGSCCGGMLWYKPFSRTPPGIKWGGKKS